MLFEKYDVPLTVNTLLPFLAPLTATVPDICWSVSPVSFTQFDVSPNKSKLVDLLNLTIPFFNIIIKLVVVSGTIGLPT